MKIATLQLLAALLLSSCASPNRHPLINAPIKPYNTAHLTAQVETTRARVTDATQHLSKAQVHEESAAASAKAIESTGTLAHSPEAVVLVDTLTKLRMELNSTQDQLTEALLSASEAKSEVATTIENRDAIASQLDDTVTKYTSISKQLDNTHDALTRSKSTISFWRRWALGATALIAIYAVLKFYFHVPFI